MSTVKISGHSDDLIEIEGDLREEFDGGGGTVHFDDGTILRATWTGVWRITLVKRGTADMSIVQAPEDDEDVYSDVVTLTGDITKVWTGESLRLGEAAYSGYFKACGGRSLISGAELPSWDEQDPRIQAAWQAAAEAVRVAL